MSIETATVLTKSLKAIDSIRRRVLVGGWLAVLVTLGAYARFYYVLRGDSGLDQLVGTAVTALTCLIAWTTFAVILIVIRMALRILRAIDLAAK
ncbi:MAG TPA: hypothetical protein VGQ36_20615 [Thermoanaerobaculia bacterium]|jgi:hypothetical protein|nr:hypothetical protein [Thermoanaerobaculia bacterium]